MSEFPGTIYNPDVLTCLANLSNDEVFTPPTVANAMLDMLPQELFRDPTTTFLDPAAKSGIFLREIAKRLIEGLADQIPDLQERIDHVFQKQLFGIAITELTSLITRRSVYCSKFANSPYAVTGFDDPAGNIRFKKTEHEWQNGKCVFCGASQSEYDRDGSLETHAYEIIHTTRPEEIYGMKFDVIIGNPPYQLSDGGAQASAKPIYNHFVDAAKRLSPRYITMIIPARWYAGGKGLDSFRDAMLDDKHIKELHDFPITDDCFPGVNIRGGVCYFLWDREYNGEQNTTVTTHIQDVVRTVQRPMKYKDLGIFIRYEQAISILNKVMDAANIETLDSIVSARKPFGLATDFPKAAGFHDRKIGLIRPVTCYAKGKSIGYVEFNEIPAHSEWANRVKVFVPRANNIGTELNDDNLNSFVGEENTICTESYIVIGSELGLTHSQAESLAAYLRTRFVRFMHSLAKSSQDATAKTYRFVPMQDFSQKWNDEMLYEKYGLTEEEIGFIEETIKPMDD